MYEVTKKPVFDELQIKLPLTPGQTDIVQRFRIHKVIEGVELVWNRSDNTGNIKFLAPKLTEILTLLRSVNVEEVEEWERKSVRGRITRTINALEQTVSERWAYATNHYARTMASNRRFAESAVPTLTPQLKAQQYGFQWEAVCEDGMYSHVASVTIAPVPFISLDGTPTIEWVCDGGGMYLTSGGKDEKRLNAETRYGTLETAIERGKATLEGRIADRAVKDEEARQTAIAKLAEIEADAFIKVQEIA